MATGGNWCRKLGERVGEGGGNQECSGNHEEWGQTPVGRGAKMRMKGVKTRRKRGRNKEKGLETRRKGGASQEKGGGMETRRKGDRHQE